MARREPTSSRRPASREPSLRLLLVCGADKTETAYFKGLRAYLNARSVNIKVLERPQAPDQVVEYARDHCFREDFDETWCVVDVDHFEAQGAKVTAAYELASLAGIGLATSNPCFELWLLLHHTNCRSYCNSCSDVEAKLRRFVPSYDKAQLKFRDHAAGVAEAVNRARELDPSGMRHKKNPSSSVWVLADRLLKAAS